MGLEALLARSFNKDTHLAFAKPLSKEYTLFSLAGDLSETLSKWFTDHSDRPGGWEPKFQGRLRRADLGIGQAEKQELRAKNEALARGYRKPIILTRDGGAKVVGRT
ncbi:hypothetical protein V1478_013843 [Vespula squamosa]|uniref:Uncharacterized protein n=1 Tax=Vespula squamosa TaxID=30214 RepID=A0ABD2A764_VESSQ